jgi:hypothetical protein
MSKIEQHPLIIVFYLDREMMQNQQITNTFTESINHMINVKKLNMLAFFLPTDGEERVECINPVIASKDEMDKIGKIIEDIKNTFDIGKLPPENNK